MEYTFTELNKQIIRIPANHHNSDVLEWCSNNEISAIFVGRYRDKDLWFIKDEANRMLFVLRWN